MKKSLLALLLVPICLGGCSLGGDPADDPNSAEGKKNLKIRFHVDKISKESEAYEKLVFDFNAAHKKEGIKVTASYVTRTGSNDQYELQLQKDMKEGTLPDIITFDSPLCARYAKKGYLYDISSNFSAAERDKYVSLNMYQGKLYGLPIQESSAGFFYNKDMFREAGVYDVVQGYTVENPWTFDQFKAVCGSLQSHFASDEFHAVDMRLDATKDETGTYLLYPIIYGAGGSFVDSTGLKATGYFDSAKSINGYKFIKELEAAGYTSNGIGATDFFTKKTAMYLSSGWTIDDCDNNYKSTFGTHDRNRWGILPYPKANGEEGASATGSWSFGITKNARKDKSLVVELLKFLTTASASKIITDKTFMLPAHKDAPYDYEAGSPEYFLRQQLQTTGRQRPETIGYSEFSSTFEKVISEMSSHETSVSKVTSIVQNKAKELDTKLQKLK